MDRIDSKTYCVVRRRYISLPAVTGRLCLIAIRNVNRFSGSPAVRTNDYSDRQWRSQTNCVA